PLRLEGKASGKVTGTLPATGGERGFEGEVELSAPKLRVQNLPAEKLTGTMTYRKGVGEYHLKGELLGGTFDLDGRIPPPPAGAAGGEAVAKPRGPVRPARRGARRTRGAGPAARAGRCGPGFPPRRAGEPARRQRSG